MKYPLILVRNRANQKIIISEEASIQLIIKMQLYIKDQKGKFSLKIWDIHLKKRIMTYKAL